jgi:hypothetical protein
VEIGEPSLIPRDVHESILRQYDNDCVYKQIRGNEVTDSDALSTADMDLLLEDDHTPEPDVHSLSI